MVRRRPYQRATAPTRTILLRNGELRYFESPDTDGVISLLKDPNARPTYAQLLEHPFLLADKEADVDMVGWVAGALEKRAGRGVTPLPPQTTEA